MEDPTEKRDREIMEREVKAEQDTLFGIVRSHEPPPPEPWVRRL